MSGDSELRRDRVMSGDGTMTTPVIGIYAHHHGSGHMFRCREIARELESLGFRVTIFSTAKGADITLADDAPDTRPTDSPTPDEGHPTWRNITAGGTAHYAPPHHQGLQDRFAVLARWIADNRPAAFYVDVSAEVTSFVRLMGVPVATIAMPGIRDDVPHQAAYQRADAIIAAWPSWVALPSYLTPHASRVHAVGGISRLSPRGDGGEQCQVKDSPHTVVVMAGQGGSTWSSGDWEKVQRACADWEFIHLGGDQRVDDPTEVLETADVAVIAGGQNSVADVAALGVPAVVLPQPRPFAEQAWTAKELDRAGLATVAMAFPAPKDWPALLENAADFEPEWHRWETAGAARRAALAVAETTQRHAVENAGRPRIAVITLTSLARVSHVHNQLGLMPLGVKHITVALSDVELVRRALPGSTVVAAPSNNLAAARNFGARVAIEQGADRLIFLDADCVASNQMIDRYLQALDSKPQAVVAGPVTYMKPGELRTSEPDPHPARPNPPAGELVRADNYDLFWSLSFAVTAETWGAIEAQFGGFDTGYTGYGGEDTDFAANLRTHGFELWWVGGAHAYHQWHPVSSPPWEHLEDIVRNAQIFYEKWGRWPMEGWLRAFAEEGAVEFVAGRWRVANR